MIYMLRSHWNHMNGHRNNRGSDAHNDALDENKKLIEGEMKLRSYVSKLLGDDGVDGKGQNGEGDLTRPEPDQSHG